jgi:hypothetical protein
MVPDTHRYCQIDETSLENKNNAKRITNVYDSSSCENGIAKFKLMTIPMIKGINSRKKGTCRAAIFSAIIFEFNN